MTEKIWLHLCALLAMVAITACEDKTDPIDDTTVDTSTEPTPTYTADVKPILDVSCTSCHAATATDRKGAPSSVNLDTYAAAKAAADEANGQIQNGGMPPGGPLSSADKLTFRRWVEGGTPE